METAESNLIPEGEFLAKNASPVCFNVQIPSMPDKSEWKLDGKTISLTLPLTDQVSLENVYLVVSDIRNSL